MQSSQPQDPAWTWFCRSREEFCTNSHWEHCQGCSTSLFFDLRPFNVSYDVEKDEIEVANIGWKAKTRGVSTQGEFLGRPLAPGGLELGRPLKQLRGWNSGLFSILLFSYSDIFGKKPSVSWCMGLLIAFVLILF